MTTKLSLSDTDVHDILTCLENKMEEIRKALGGSQVLDILAFRKDKTTYPDKYALIKQFVNTKRLYDYIDSKYQVS